MTNLCNPKGKRRSIQLSDPGRILDLVMHLTDDSCAKLQRQINLYLMDECEADMALQIVVNKTRLEAFIEAVGDNSLVKRVRIILDLKLLDLMKQQVGKMEYFHSLDPGLQQVISPFIKNYNPNNKVRMSLFPVCETPFSVIVIVISPKINEEHVPVFINECFKYVWPTLKKAIWLEYECVLKQKCQQLLKVAKRLFCTMASLKPLLKLAMIQAKLLMRAQFCSVMLIDTEKMQLVETIYETGPGETGSYERRFSMDVGIVGQVIKTGELINCKKAKDHPFYNPDIDSQPDVECQSLLCFPIRDQSGIIGVAKLINKIEDLYFDGMDEEMALAYSIYCGVCIVHSVIYDKIQEAHIRNSLANELVMYHMKVTVTDAEVYKLLDCKATHNAVHFSSTHFSARGISPRELPCYVLKMFHDLKFDKIFKIRSHKLARFVLLVQKGYRDVPYHNWIHAFGVAQWAYAAMLNFGLINQGYLTELQGLMYLVSGLVHDIDHRGTTNQFQIEGQTNLAALYSSEGSVLERHHLAQGMCILNTEGCDILENLPRRDYDKALIIMRDFILATDLSTYFKHATEYKAIARDFQKQNKLHLAALHCMLINAADLSDQLKDWYNVKKTAAAVLTEFFNQGDEEKSRGYNPAVIMDRDKCVIPELEIQFLETVCIPIFDNISRIIPKAMGAVKILEAHIEKWDACKPIFAEVPTTAGLSVLLSPELDNLIDKEIKERERLQHEAEEAAKAQAEEQPK